LASTCSILLDHPDFYRAGRDPSLALGISEKVVEAVGVEPHAGIENT
jgi:hypothetical protein